MSKRQYYDYLIIGQGLAGSLLAWRLVKSGLRILVIDNANPAAASRVSAGLVNPVTGKRLVKEAGAGDYLATAGSCYAQLSEEFGKTFYHPIPMLRLFDSDGVKEAWQKRLTESGYQDYIGDEISPIQCGYDTGGFLQHQTGYLDTGALLDSLRQWLEEQGALLTAQFDYAELQAAEPVSWRDCRAGGVIFCEGARVTDNPWFDWLPMQPAQGEILSCMTSDELPQWIINSGKWVLPMQDGCFRLGATYVWPTEEKPLDEQITEAGKQTLLAAMPQLAPGVTKYELLGQSAGIRPNSLDKQPLLGFHPQFPQLAVFNGFGSKGSLLIPYFSQHFTDVLLNGLTLQAEVDIRRVQS